MKKGITLLIVLLVTLRADAQTLTAKEMLEEVKCKTFKCINERIIPRGFVFMNWPGQEGETRYAYTSKTVQNDISELIKIKNAATLIVYSDSSSTLSYIITVPEQYNALISEFLKNTFEKAKEETDSFHREVVYYKSVSYPGISLTVFTSTVTKGESTYKSYDFELNREAGKK